MEKTIRAFGRSELAQQYFPQISPMSAWRKFREWLVLNPSPSHVHASRGTAYLHGVGGAVEIITSQ